MNIGRAKIYPLTILAWVATFYMLVVGIHDWRLWLSVGFVFAEQHPRSTIIVFDDGRTQDDGQECAEGHASSGDTAK